jgi:Protein DA1
VSAHEFTHAWLHENIPATRRLEKDTIEGFCELVAYKLMTERREETQKRVILDNAYTRGQVHAFVQAENAHHFQTIIQWLKTGVDESLVETNGARVLATADEPPPVFTWPPPLPRPTAVPGSLRLKGIAGSPARRFALINDTTLVKNEEARIRVGATNVTVRCLDIHPRSVVIQVQGSTRPTELFLGAAD